MQIDGFVTYEKSITIHENCTYALLQEPATRERRLAVRGDLRGFMGDPYNDDTLVCPLTATNAAALRSRLPWLKPVPLGMATSAGFGDRLGIATPGHVLSVQGAACEIAPIFAQQSMRENARTGRTPQQVIDEAMWGVFQAGWQKPWGADADHLKVPTDIDKCVEAGYAFFTVDPGEYVDNAADEDEVDTLREKVRALPWDVLDTTWDDLAARYVGQRFDLGTLVLEFDEVTLLRAVAKYGGALAHAITMHAHLVEKMAGRPYDFEVSVDETETPTTIHEHYVIAAELRRSGVPFVSLAPRFVGRFEKGVDYIGDLDALDQNLAGHGAVLRHFGGYKLSLHSGSDKYSVYPIAARHAEGAVHLKTAGTSYLEALRVWAEVDPAAFREIVAFTQARYPTDRATYHVSADVSRMPDINAIPDTELPDVLDQFDTREVLHVTFGSVLDEHGPALDAMLRDNEERYHAVLNAHFARHLAPFCEA